jgi:hypothetical protein
MPRDDCDFVGDDNRGVNGQHRGNHCDGSRAGWRMLLRVVGLCVRDRAFRQYFIVRHHHSAPLVILDILWATGL